MKKNASKTTRREESRSPTAAAAFAARKRPKAQSFVSLARHRSSHSLSIVPGFKSKVLLEKAQGEKRATSRSAERRAFLLLGEGGNKRAALNEVPDKPRVESPVAHADRPFEFSLRRSQHSVGERFEPVSKAVDACSLCVQRRKKERTRRLRWELCCKRLQNAVFVLRSHRQVLAEVVERKHWKKNTPASAEHFEKKLDAPRLAVCSSAMGCGSNTLHEGYEIVPIVLTSGMRYLSISAAFRNAAMDSSWSRSWTTTTLWHTESSSTAICKDCRIPTTRETGERRNCRWEKKIFLGAPGVRRRCLAQRAARREASDHRGSPVRRGQLRVRATEEGRCRSFAAKKEKREEASPELLLRCFAQGSFSPRGAFRARRRRSTQGARRELLRIAAKRNADTRREALAPKKTNFEGRNSAGDAEIRCTASRQE